MEHLLQKNKCSIFNNIYKSIQALIKFFPCCLKIENDVVKDHVFENIKKNGAYALLKQMLHFP